jgi:hypothetical protein
LEISGEDMVDVVEETNWYQIDIGELFRFLEGFQKDSVMRAEGDGDRTGIIGVLI